MPQTHGSHWMEREDIGDVTVIRFKVAKLPIDDLTRELFDQIYSIVDDFGRSRMVLNLERVDYISSLGLGKLVMLNRKTLTGGGRLALCCLSPNISDVLAVTHLVDVLDTYREEKDAIASFAKSTDS